jgi:hypothetical protein
MNNARNRGFIDKAERRIALSMTGYDHRQEADRVRFVAATASASTATASASTATATAKTTGNSYGINLTQNVLIPLSSLLHFLGSCFL